jgi:hypothetical protein
MLWTRTSPTPRASSDPVTALPKVPVPPGSSTTRFVQIIEWPQSTTWPGPAERDPGAADDA